MIQGARGADFLFEAAPPVGIVGRGGQQDLNRHLPADAWIAHAAGSQ